MSLLENLESLRERGEENGKSEEISQNLSPYQTLCRKAMETDVNEAAKIREAIHTMLKLGYKVTIEDPSTRKTSVMNPPSNANSQ